MRNAERIVVVVTILVLCGISVWGYTAVRNERLDYRERVAAGEFEIRPDVQPLAHGDVPEDLTIISEETWRAIYPVTYPMRVGDVAVEASVADTLSLRIKGLSDTPYLPANVVKLFAFGVAGSHPIWMKDMNYPIDIIWANESGEIVHIVEQVSPDTYDSVTPTNSQSFASPVPAWFVVETNAGFVAQHQITVGDSIALPQSE